MKRNFDIVGICFSVFYFTAYLSRDTNLIIKIKILKSNRILETA